METQIAAPGKSGNQSSEDVLKSLANLMYCVGTENNIGVWNGSQWNDCTCPWTVVDMVFDNKNQCWVVGTGGNVGILDLSSGDIIINYGNIGGWTIQSIDFDANGVLWCVATGGNVGRWNGYSWDNLGMLGGWTLQSICVRNMIGNALCWGVSTGNELSLYGFPDPDKWGNNLFPLSGPIRSVASTSASSATVYIGTVRSDMTDALILWNTGEKLGGWHTNWNLITVAFMAIPKI